VTRVVLDTVIFVRALINRRSPAGRIVFELYDRYELIVSDETVREAMEVITRPVLRARLPYLSHPPALAAVTAILDDAERAEVDTVPPVCRDPHDDKFFACALAGAADYIVSEDRDILAVGEYAGIRTIGAAEFIQLLVR